MDANPLVSIIVRTKDRPKLLKRALQSIAGQTYRPVEVVLVNDGGCDLDSQELKGILGDVSLKYLRLEKNMGRAQAANVGIENAKGRYLGFLDDDDIYYPNAVKSLHDAIEGSDAVIVYGKVVCRTYETPHIAEQSDQKILGMAFDQGRLVFENFIPINSLLVPRSCFGKTGLFDRIFEIYEDWDYLIRLAQTYEFSFVDSIVAEYSIFETATITGKGGVSTQNYYRLKLLEKHIDKATAKDFLSYVQSIIDRVVLEKDARIHELSAALDREKLSLAHVQKENSLKDEEIRLCDEEIGRLRSHSESLKESIELKNREIEQLLLRRAELEKELEGILSSESWKITKPLRAVGSVLRKIAGTMKS